ncbi:MAG: two-component regulator propeller domain-containing protein, partial [Bacteroidota bacterium]
RRSLILVLLCGLIPTLVNGQNDSLVFYSVEGDISQSTIVFVHQDSLGFLWVGTRYGLNQYDGQTFRQIYASEEDSTGLPNNTLAGSYVTPDGFWVATRGGASFYDSQTGHFTTLVSERDNPNSLTHPRATRFHIDDEKSVWIGTEDGLNKYDPETKTIKQYPLAPRNSTAFTIGHVSGVGEDPTGNLWVGTWFDGLYRYRPEGDFFEGYSHPYHIKELGRIRCLVPGSNTLWVGTERGVFHLDTDHGEPNIEPLHARWNSEASDILANAVILSMLEAKDGTLWIGTENKGLFLYHPSNNTLVHYAPDSKRADGLPVYSIWSLYQDNTGIVWIGTFNGGLLKVDVHHQKFQHVRRILGNPNSLSYNAVSSFAEDANGNLWIGTDGGGLNYLDEEKGEYTHYRHVNGDPTSLPSDAILATVVDHKGTLWVGTYDGGLSYKKPNQEGFYTYAQDLEDPDALHGYNVFAMMEDYQGNIWVGDHLQGISIYLQEEDRFIHLGPELPKDQKIQSGRIRVLYEDAPGSVWIGTEMVGLEHIWLDDEYNILRSKHYVSDRLITQGMDVTITDIHRDRQGRIWVSSFNKGITVLKSHTDELTKLTTRSGLPSDIVFGITEDKNGTIWASTGEGLCAITQDFEVTTYQPSDGLQGTEFIKNSCMVSRQGEVFFGGINGFNRFYPEAVQSNKVSPPVHITGFALANSDKHQYTHGNPLDLLHPEGLHLKYNENDFSFQMAVLNYSQPTKNGYHYRLEPLEDNWNQSATGYDLRYTNVPPGTYTFRVRGANNDGKWNPDEATFTIFIARPWWNSYYAYAVYALFIIGLLLWSRQNIINRERLKNELKYEHLELTKAQELSDVKSRFFANISHEFRTPLTLILGPLRSLLKGTFHGDPKDQYKVMLRNGERLLNLINQILELSKVESGSLQLQVSELDLVATLKPIIFPFNEYAERKYLTFTVSFPKNKVTLWADPDKLEKIVVNLLSNAFKYTPEYGQVSVAIEIEANHCKVRIQDTGVGIAEENMAHIFDRFYQVNNKVQGTGIGLALTKELVELHHGTIEVDSRVGEGTCFCVSIPLGKDHFTQTELATAMAPTEAPQETPPRNEAANNKVHEKPTLLPVSEGKPLTLLIAEDNDDMRQFLVQQLEGHYQILEAANGQQALVLAQAQNPDAILSDVMMPELDGFELCAQIKSNPDTAHIPVILL